MKMWRDDQPMTAALLKCSSARILWSSRSSIFWCICRHQVTMYRLFMWYQHWALSELEPVLLQQPEPPSISSEPVRQKLGFLKSGWEILTRTHLKFVSCCSIVELLLVELLPCTFMPAQTWQCWTQCVSDWTADCLTHSWWFHDLISAVLSDALCIK